jgi:hypothetical protein
VYGESRIPSLGLTGAAEKLAWEARARITWSLPLSDRRRDRSMKGSLRPDVDRSSAHKVPSPSTAGLKRDPKRAMRCHSYVILNTKPRASESPMPNRWAAQDSSGSIQGPDAHGCENRPQTRVAGALAPRASLPADAAPHDGKTAAHLDILSMPRMALT